MTDAKPWLGRRHAMRFLASLPFLYGTAMAAPRPDVVAAPHSAMPDEITILAAGPEGGETERWGRLIATALGRSFPVGATIRVAGAGAADGVTVANQFDARAAPDGGTALLVPGAAALAWLAGDPRARFDAGRWVPVLAGVTPGLVVGRNSPAMPTGWRPRVAAAGPSGPDMAALLGLALIGAAPVPVFGLMDAGAADAAFARGDVDLIFLSGRRVPERCATLAAIGAKPMFSLGGLEADGTPTRDPLFPDVPDMTELYASARGERPSGRLYDAWVAAASATRLDFALVLPPLTPAATVAFWRHACVLAAATPEMQAAATFSSVHPLAGPAATASTASVAADSATILELRHWLGARFNWPPA